MKRIDLLFVLLSFLGLIGCSRSEHELPEKAKEKVSTEVNQAISRVTGRELTEEVDKMEGTKHYSLSVMSSPEDKSVAGIMSFRCSSGKNLEAVVGLDDLVDSTGSQSRVRLKFDQGLPIIQEWNESSNYQGLFSPNPYSLMKSTLTANVLLFEYQKFHDGKIVLTFDVTGLREGLPKLDAACGLSEYETKVAEAQALGRAARERAQARQHGQECFMEAARPHDIQIVLCVARLLSCAKDGMYDNEPCDASGVRSYCQKTNKSGWQDEILALPIDRCHLAPEDRAFLHSVVGK
ncbi:MAG: hypothetical protein LAN83_10185 [Acidobacteriia bacterium]|nr:hypothetical protein [Terriglobia bacterium]